MPGEREIAQALLSSYEPSLRERAGNAIYDVARALGMSSTANRMRNEGTAVMDFIPGVGEVLGVNDAMNDFSAGNYGMAAAGLGLTAAGVVPGVGDAVANAGRKGIRAFHGSPHDFDRFDMSKIGTGEGAQAYGHGLYFAEAEDVAKAYRDALSGRPDPSALGYLSKAGGDKAKAIAAMEADLAGRAPSKHVDAMRAEIMQADAPRGRMYEVNINADPDDFLDWDAPLRDQQHIAERLGVDPYARSKRADEIIRNIQEDMKAAGRTEMDAIDRQNYELAERLNQEFAFETGSSYAPRSQEMLDDLLAKGVKGVKYRDYGSRGSDGGTHNFVVFDDSLIEIVKKYGLAGAVAAGLISQEMAAQMQAQGMGEI